MMNATSKIKVFQITKIIEINTTFEKECRDPSSDEYKTLQEVRKDYPDFILQVRHIKKNPKKQKYHKLTYEYMRDYIILTSTPEEELEAVAEFDNMILKSRCQSQSNRYPVIKRWFLNKYPEIKEFGMITLDDAA